MALDQIRLITIALILFIALDLLWMRLFMGSFFRVELGALAAKDVRVWSAVLAWVLMAVGVVLFVLPRVGSGGSVLSALLWGGLFGLMLYGVFDFTNYAIIEDYTIRFLVVDVLWGTVLCGVVTLILTRLL